MMYLEQWLMVRRNVYNPQSSSRGYLSTAYNEQRLWSPLRGLSNTDEIHNCINMDIQIKKDGETLIPVPD